MFKVTEEGITEMGKPIELDLRDQVEILKIIARAETPPSIAKKNGKWVQVDPAKEYTSGHRIFHGG